MSSNAEKLYKLIANDSKKKQSLFMTALTNPKKALDKICDIGNELNISVTKEEKVPICSSKADIDLMNPRLGQKTLLASMD